MGSDMKYRSNYHVALLMLAVLSAPILPGLLVSGPVGGGPGHILDPGGEKADPVVGSVAVRSELHIEFGLDRVLRDGDAYTGVRIKDGAVDEGFFGEERPFLPVQLFPEGKIDQMEVRFYDKVVLRPEPVPYLRPSPLLDMKEVISPEWRGRVNDTISYGWELFDLSSNIENGYHGREYTLRLYPVEYAGESAEISTRAVVTYFYTPGELWHPIHASGKPTGDVKYLIITHSSLSEALEPLAEWKSMKGKLARIMTVGDIEEEYSGKDIQEKMRNCVMEFESNYDLDHLLLAGDVDLVKTRATINTNPYPGYGEGTTFGTDLYFACVDESTSWNSDNDGVYAEVGELDDHIPDMAVGRLAISDPTTMSLKVEELITREKELEYDPKRMTAVYMVGNPLSNPGDPVDTVDNFWTLYGDGEFDSRETLYFDGTGTKAFSSGGFKSVVGKGYQAYSYFSHGQKTGIPNLYSNDQVPSLSADGPEGVFFAMACLTGWFDDSGNCFAEAMTETPDVGVLAYMGASRLAVGAIDKTYSGDAPGLEEDFWRIMREVLRGNVSPTAGDVWRETISYFAHSFYPFTDGGMANAAMRTYLEYNMVGEPDAPLMFSEWGDLKLEYALSRERDNITVNVTDGYGDPVAGANVTLYRAGELGLVGRTGVGGNVTMSIPENNGGTVNLSAYKMGYHLVNTTIQLHDRLEPTALYSVSPPFPDGRRGVYITTPTVTLYGDEPVSVEYGWDGGEIFAGPQGQTSDAPEGAHKLLFRVEDRMGLLSPWVEVNFSVDLTLPEMGVNTTPAKPDGEKGWFVTRPTVELSSLEPLEDVTYKLNSWSYVDYSGPFELPEGINTITFKGYDLSGNLNTTSEDIRIDLTPPSSDVTISHLPDGERNYYITPPNITLREFQEEGSWGQYRWDEGEWNLFTTPVQPPEGIHSFQYRGIDEAGNIEQEKTLVFKVDTIFPELSLDVEPGKPDGDNGYYRVKPAVTAESTEGEVHYILEPTGTYVDWRGDHLNFPSTLYIENGLWTLHVRVVDPAGNTRYADPLEFKVDTEDPEFTWAVSPFNPDGENGWYRAQPILTVDILSKNTTADWSYQGSSNWTELTGPLRPSEGVHDLVLRAVDIAGNIVMASPGEIKVDRQDPILEILGPEEGSVFGVFGPEVIWSGSDNTSGIMLFETCVDNGEWLNRGLAEDLHISNLSNGRHRISVRATDMAGNLVVKVRHFSMDTVAPSVKFHTPIGSSIPLDEVIMVTFSEPMDKNTVNVTVVGVEGDLSWENFSLTFTPGAFLDHSRTYTVIVTGRDIYGNSLGVFNWTFTTVIIEEQVSEKEERIGPIPFVIGGAVVVLILIVLTLVILFKRTRRYSNEDVFFLDEE